ncbi:MAG: immune inhibitor A, partial [Anaerolineae bacterium]|nr:immune inhibitor A [Anaerolineae bacterium]
TFTPTPTHTPTITFTPTPSSTPGRLLLPLVMDICPPIVRNGSFEEGLQSWGTGGELAVDSSASGPHGGILAALLGSPLYRCKRAPEGQAWLSQSIRVPSNGAPALRFWYRIVTYDRNKDLLSRGDYLEVQVEGDQVLRDMKREGEYGRCDLPPSDLGWREAVVDLSPWRGQEVEIRFLLHTDDEYNTWVYIDDVSVR